MFAVIYIPDFSLQSVLRLESGLQHEQAFSIGSIAAAVLDPGTPQTLIFQLTRSARDAGVAEGMTAAQALARSPGIAIHIRSESSERTAMEALLDCANSFSPDIEATADGVVTLDLKGFKNVSWEEYARRMVEQVCLLRLNAQVGVAENPLLAFHAARAAKPVRVIARAAEADSRSGAEQFLASLPIEAVEPSPQTLQILKQWGVQTIGAFVNLGRKAMSERLGEEGVRLFERARARHSRPLNRMRPAEHFEEGIDFEHEIETAAPLLFVLRRFAQQLSVRMGMAGQVAQTLTLVLKFSNGRHCEHVLQVPEPTGDEAVLFLMLQTHLEQFKSDHPITGLRLSATPCPGRSRQLGLFASSLRDPNRFGETLARLEALVGAGRAGSPAVLPTHRPDAFEMQPVNFESTPQMTASRRRIASGRETHPDSAARSCVAGLPLRRFRPPLSARVELRDSCPVTMWSAGSVHDIHEARGPWRSSGDWWDGPGWGRDEWDVQTADGILYRLVQQQGAWFVEGVYD